MKVLNPWAFAGAGGVAGLARGMALVAVAGALGGCGPSASGVLRATEVRVEERLRAGSVEDAVAAARTTAKELRRVGEADADEVAEAEALVRRAELAYARAELARLKGEAEAGGGVEALQRLLALRDAPWFPESEDAGVEAALKPAIAAAAAEAEAAAREGRLTWARDVAAWLVRVDTSPARLEALMGYEARAIRPWRERAAGAGDPTLRIFYESIAAGLTGEVDSGLRKQLLASAPMGAALASFDGQAACKGEQVEAGIRRATAAMLRAPEAQQRIAIEVAGATCGPRAYKVQEDVYRTEWDEIRFIREETVYEEVVRRREKVQCTKNFGQSTLKPGRDRSRDYVGLCDRAVKGIQARTEKTEHVRYLPRQVKVGTRDVTKKRWSVRLPVLIALPDGTKARVTLDSDAAVDVQRHVTLKLEPLLEAWSERQREAALQEAKRGDVSAGTARALGVGLTLKRTPAWVTAWFAEHEGLEPWRLQAVLEGRRLDTVLEPERREPNEQWVDGLDDYVQHHDEQAAALRAYVNRHNRPSPKASVARSQRLLTSGIGVGLEGAQLPLPGAPVSARARVELRSVELDEDIGIILGGALGPQWLQSEASHLSVDFRWRTMSDAWAWDFGLELGGSTLAYDDERSLWTPTFGALFAVHLLRLEWMLLGLEGVYNFREDPPQTSIDPKTGALVGRMAFHRLSARAQVPLFDRFAVGAGVDFHPGAPTPLGVFASLSWQPGLSGEDD